MHTHINKYIHTYVYMHACIHTYTYMLTYMHYTCVYILHTYTNSEKNVTENMASGTQTLSCYQQSR